MGVLSKFVGSGLGLPLTTYNCYEAVHTWSPDCKIALFETILSGAKSSMRTYTVLYVITTLLRRPSRKDVDVNRLLHDIVRSSAFLTTNLGAYLVFLCLFRNSLGFFSVPTIAIPALLASAVAIPLEQKRRRGMLALYLTNLASETLFRMMCNRGYIRALPNGEVFLFSLALAGYFYLLKKGTLDKGLASLLHILFGFAKPENNVIDASKLPWFVEELLGKLRGKWGKHSLCLHKDSCVSYASEGFLRNFCLSYSAVAGMRLLGALPSNLTSPSKLLSVFAQKRTFLLPTFFGLMPAIYQSAVCVLKRAFNQNTPAVHAIAGACAGLSMLPYPSVSISMYVLWKLIEILYMKGVEMGKLPSHRHGDILAYTLSTGFVLFVAAIEPQSLRRGYFDFLDDLTGQKFQIVNRYLFNKFGMDSDREFRDVALTLDPQYTSANPAFLLRNELNRHC